MNSHPTKIAAIVVTYNRRLLLERCLNSLVNQTRKPDHILIVDNASTDGTPDFLESKGWLQRTDIELLALSENTGGSGGFAIGLDRAIKAGAEWAWMMDDDAEPHLDALENLSNRSLVPGNVYGSVAIAGERLSWPMMPNNGRASDAIHSTAQLPEEIDVYFIPFLGILIGTELVRRIGLPDAGFFLAADDVDYCLRARKSGAKVLLVGSSRIEHPASERHHLSLPWRDLHSLKLSPWKRYYDVRNRIFVARNHYGLGLWYSTIPGSFLRLAVTLWYEDNRWQQMKAFFAGMCDGLFGHKGRRHERWGIK